MCDFTRRGFFGTAAAFLSAAAEAELMEGAAPESDAYGVEEVVPGVHFAKGDTEGRGFCNSGFVVFDDYVLAIDATYPAGAPPSVLFPKELYFDDGQRRVELVHLGVGHTHGDAVAWLPKEATGHAARRLFSRTSSSSSRPCGTRWAQSSRSSPRRRLGVASRPSAPR